MENLTCYCRASKERYPQILLAMKITVSGYRGH